MITAALVASIVMAWAAWRFDVALHTPRDTPDPKRDLALDTSFAVCAYLSMSLLLGGILGCIT